MENHNNKTKSLYRNQRIKINHQQWRYHDVLQNTQIITIIMLTEGTSAKNVQTNSDNKFFCENLFSFENNFEIINIHLTWSIIIIYK